MKTIGIDLGTSNTYIFSWDSATWSGGGRPKPIILQDITDSGGSLATVILYEDGKPLCIGNLAESEYFAHPDSGGRRKIRSQFKPEIDRGEPWALEAMTDFLTLLGKALPNGLLENANVHVGIPARVRQDFAITLGKCFSEAGWPAISFVQEPDAALVSCLDLGILSVADIGCRCLILDFGGGTFDYTAVESLNVLSQGGDALYGGRLFDDLFYQLFCGRNPDFARAMPKSPFAYYAHWVECKNQKELFSRIVSDEKAAKASLLLPWYDRKGERFEAWVNDYGRDDFVANAEHFVATDELQAILSAYRNSGGLGVNASELLAGKEIALIGWLHGLLENVADRGQIEKVVLTGGSSRWFFVLDAAKRFFPAASVVRSGRDYEDIAYGLALYPALAVARERARELLDGKMEAFCAKETDEVRKLLASAADRLIIDSARRITERDIMPVLEGAKENRPTLQELEDAIDKSIREDGDLYVMFRRAGQNLAGEIRRKVDGDFKHWLVENGVPLTAGIQIPDEAVNLDFFDGLATGILRPEDLDKFLVTRLLPLIGGLTAAGLIAHTLEPVSTIIGGGAVFGGTWLLSRYAPFDIRNRKIPTFMLGDRIRPKITAKITRHIEEHLHKAFDRLEENLATEIGKRLRASLESMIANLGIFNQIVVS